MSDPSLSVSLTSTGRDKETTNSQVIENKPSEDSVFKKPPIRYLFKRGILIANDFINSLPPDRMEKVHAISGLWILEINKPVKGLFVAAGTSGRFFHNEEFCAEFTQIPGNYAQESFVMGQVINILDPEQDQLIRKSMRALYIFIDIERVEGKFLRVPSDQELTTFDKKYLKMRVNKIKSTKEEDIHLSRNYRRLGRLLFLNRAYDMVPFGEPHDPDDVSDIEGFMMRAIQKEEERAKKQKKKTLWDKILPKKKPQGGGSDEDMDENEVLLRDKTRTRKRANSEVSGKKKESDSEQEDSDEGVTKSDPEAPKQKRRKYTRKAKEPTEEDGTVKDETKKKPQKKRLSKEEKQGIVLNKLEKIEDIISKAQSKTSRPKKKTTDKIEEKESMAITDPFVPDTDELDDGKIKKQWTTYLKKHQLQYQPQEKSIVQKIVPLGDKRPGERPALSRLPQGSQGLLAQQLLQVPLRQKTEVQNTKLVVDKALPSSDKKDQKVEAIEKKIFSLSDTKITQKAGDEASDFEGEVDVDSDEERKKWSDCEGEKEKESSEFEFGSENEFQEHDDSEEDGKGNRGRNEDDEYGEY